MVHAGKHNSFSPNHRATHGGRPKPLAPQHVVILSDRSAAQGVEGPAVVFPKTVLLENCPANAYNGCDKTGARALSSSRIKLTWPLVAGLVLALILGVLAALRIWSSQHPNSNAIPPIDPEKKDRMTQICIFPQTLHTKDQMAVVYAADSTASHPSSSARRIPVLEEPYPPLVEVEAAIGKADLTDGGWMEWKENAADPANTNWYLRMAFSPDGKLKEIASRTSSHNPEGCTELRIGRAPSDWSQSAKANAECGTDCR